MNNEYFTDATYRRSNHWKSERWKLQIVINWLENKCFEKMKKLTREKNL